VARAPGFPGSSRGPIRWRLAESGALRSCAGPFVPQRYTGGRSARVSQ